MKRFQNLIQRVLAQCVLFVAAVGNVQAAKFEITPYVGQMFSSDLREPLSVETISVDSGTNFGIGLAWFDSPKGQGQVLLNHVSHNFSSKATGNKHKVAVTYAHFNGVALFRQNKYVTTLSLGLGGAYFKTDESSNLTPSATIAVGTRYEFSNNFAFVTELRGYASLVKEDDDSFCSNDICSAQFKGAAWLDTSVSVGLAYSF